MSPQRKIQGFLPVLAAIFGNAIIAFFKFLAFFISGSSAMFSEAVHSAVDTVNQILLFVGIKRSQKRPDEEYVYGYGRERFLWALISSCGIFFLGAGITTYRGVSSLIRGYHVTISPIILVLLAVSLVVESATLYFAFRELRRAHRGESFAKALETGDPATLAVFYEDSVAVLSILIASASVILTKLTGKIFYDAIGSILIGLLLGLVAIILINKNRGYLVGKAMSPEIQERVIEILVASPAIEKVLDFKSSILDVGKYRIKCEVEFNGSALMKALNETAYIKEEYPSVKNSLGKFVRFCADYIDRIPRLVGKEIDKLEKKIQKEFPEIAHIDIELN